MGKSTNWKPRRVNHQTGSLPRSPRKNSCLNPLMLWLGFILVVSSPNHPWRHDHQVSTCGYTMVAWTQPGSGFSSLGFLVMIRTHGVKLAEPGRYQECPVHQMVVNIDGVLNQLFFCGTSQEYQELLI